MQVLNPGSPYELALMSDEFALGVYGCMVACDAECNQIRTEQRAEWHDMRHTVYDCVPHMLRCVRCIAYAVIRHGMAWRHTFQCLVLDYRVYGMRLKCLFPAAAETDAGRGRRPPDILLLLLLLLLLLVVVVVV